MEEPSFLATECISINYSLNWINFIFPDSIRKLLIEWKKKKEKATAEGNLNGIFYACKELAEIYFQEEKYDEALLQYKDMEKTCEESGNKIDYARAHRMIGEVYCEKGQFEKAIKHQMIHLNISREVNDSVEEQRALATLGRTFFLQSESFPQSLMGLTSSSEKTRALHMAKTYYVDSLSVCERYKVNIIPHVGCCLLMYCTSFVFFLTWFIMGKGLIPLHYHLVIRWKCPSGEND
ncbi:hypothetical protein AAG570_011857 [Ranatra chinensis]|uniref:Uncharacterized protein n=1 Tax=Ranatra chinensis TaxID=642074 RepID=A0ABD0YHC1_9HEMI